MRFQISSVQNIGEFEGRRVPWFLKKKIRNPVIDYLYPVWVKAENIYKIILCRFRDSKDDFGSPLNLFHKKFRELKLNCGFEEMGKFKMDQIVNRYYQPVF